MSTQNKLFTSDQPLELGLGYHNVGSGTLRYAHADIIKYVDKHYGQRCGHIPLNAKQVGILVEEKNEAVVSQMAYLSQLFGREIKIMTFQELKAQTKEQTPFIVPYTLVPETEKYFKDLKTKLWGMPGKMAHVLKSKSEFHHLVDNLAVEGFQTPTEYVVSHIDNIVEKGKELLKKIVAIYDQAGVLNEYPLGLMLRASDEDGNYGCVRVYEKNKFITLVPNGDTEHAKIYGNWDEALIAAQSALNATIDAHKESRIVIDRYVDIIDSPGMSLLMLNGKTYSLGWNGQFMEEGSNACRGTHSYTPKTAYLKQFQQAYEEKTAEIFGSFLKKTAQHCKYNFNEIQGLANIDIIIPSELEKHLQKKRGQKHNLYFTECNARWTNWTDAISTVLGVERKEQTVDNMLAVIQNGIWTYDKYKLPKGVDPKVVRELIFEKDQKLKKTGTRIICRMADNPMGLIFVGDLKLAELEMKKIVERAAGSV